MASVGCIYFYPAGYVGSTVNLEQRHKGHLRKHPTWSKPVVLERCAKEDLLFQEVIWMFKLHTYQRIWPQGLNKVIPFTNDYRQYVTQENCARGGRKGGGKHEMSAAAKARQLAACVRAGQNGGGKHTMSEEAKERQRAGVREANKLRKGASFTESHRKNLSAAISLSWQVRKAACL